jgi:putative nucleotidyltransferase with HDIG domain
MPKILIVDDEENIRSILSEMLEVNGYACKTAATPLEARELLKDEKFELILCDINMPGESGLDFIRDILPKHPETAAIMITALDDPMVAEVALKIGVYDYITKPFEMNNVMISVANTLRRRQLEIENKAYQKSLEQKVAERTTALQKSMNKLQQALEGSIRAMALTVEMRDPYTSGHQQRVASIAKAIAKEMGMPKEQIEGILMAGLIHDLGKIAIPAEILAKPGPITETEFELIKSHPDVGYEILKNIEFPWPIAHIVLQHHERIDGSGYPSGLSGNQILMEAKILGVADVVEAMASHRPYRPALGIDVALQEISKNSGLLYDPDVADACLTIFRQKGFKLSQISNDTKKFN